MSIRPVDFNGMIQNSNEVSHAKANEDARPALNQANISVEIDKHQQQLSHRVNQKEEKNQSGVSYEREGDGKGYQGNQNRQKKNNQMKESKGGSDVVIKKTSTSSFDVKI